MNLFNQIILRVLATLALAIPIGTHAQEDPNKVQAPSTAVETFLKGDKTTLRKLAAHYASKKIDFLDISYLEPNDSNDDGGFSAAYKWNAEFSDQWVGENNGHYKKGNIRFVTKAMNNKNRTKRK